MPFLAAIGLGALRGHYRAVHHMEFASKIMLNEQALNFFIHHSFYGGGKHLHINLGLGRSRSRFG